MLYRLLVRKEPVTTIPAPEGSTGWPTNNTYNGTQQQTLFGADVNNQFVVCSTASSYQINIQNTINRAKASSLFVYELDSEGNFVGGRTNIAVLNYTYQQTSWQRFLYCGANPAQTRTFAATRQNGTDTQSSNGNWSSTTSTAAGIIYYWNGASYSSVGAAGWVQRPIWNAAGTHIAGAMTASTGSSTAGIINLTSWSGTSVLSSTNYTIGGSYIQDYFWVNDFLIINSKGTTSGDTFDVYERVGNTLAFRSTITHTALSGAYTNVALGFSQPDPANNRFFAPVMTATDSGGATTTNLVGLTVYVDSSGNLTATPIIGGSTVSNGTTARWAAYPVSSDNKLVIVAGNSSYPTQLFSTTPTVSRVPLGAGSSLNGGGRVLLKQHAISGSVVSASTGGVQVYKLP